MIVKLLLLIPYGAAAVVEDGARFVRRRIERVYS